MEHGTPRELPKEEEASGEPSSATTREGVDELPERITSLILDASKLLPLRNTSVLVEGGVARWTGQRWESLIDGNRPIQWEVRWWSPLIHLNAPSVSEEPKSSDDSGFSQTQPSGVIPIQKALAIAESWERTASVQFARAKELISEPEVSNGHYNLAVAYEACAQTLRRLSGQKALDADSGERGGQP